MELEVVVEDVGEVVVVVDVGVVVVVDEVGEVVVVEDVGEVVVVEDVGEVVVVVEEVVLARDTEYTSTLADVVLLLVVASRVVVWTLAVI